MVRMVRSQACEHVVRTLEKLPGHSLVEVTKGRSQEDKGNSNQNQQLTERLALRVSPLFSVCPLWPP